MMDPVGVHSPASRFFFVLSIAAALFSFCGGAAQGALVNGSFESTTGNFFNGDLVPGWQVSGENEYSCIAQNTAPYPCGPDGGNFSGFPLTQADGTRAYRNGGNGDFPRDPNNPDESTNSIYEATWADIISLNYNYLYQDVATIPGGSYLLSLQLQAKFALQPYYGFWVVIDQVPVMNLSVRTQTDPVLRTDTANQWGSFSVPFIATGAVTQIGFASFVECNRHGCDIDLYLDDVQLSGPEEASAVPEPATVAGVGAALPVLAGFAHLRRRRRNRA